MRRELPLKPEQRAPLAKLDALFASLPRDLKGLVGGWLPPWAARYQLNEKHL